MKKLMMVIFAVILGGVLASCATLSEEQCQAGDWRAIGFQDGDEGRPADYISNHADACSEYGISVDQALYADGRSDGLAQYCRLSRAESEGREGEPYFGVCQGELGVAFARVHRAADDIHDAMAEINSLDSRISSLIDRLAQPEQSDEQIAAITLELRGLQRDRQSLQMRMRSLELQLAQSRRAEEARLAALGTAA